MKPIFYLYKRTWINRVKRAVKKPVTYIWLFFFLFYFVLILNSITKASDVPWLQQPSLLTALLTVVVFIFIPSNLISYTRKKGLIFRQSDIHFLFPSPVSPKKILLYAHIRTVLSGTFLNLLVTICGVYLFHIAVWKMLVYFVFSCVIENILEAALMVLCYGNEKFGRKQMLAVRIMLYIFIGIFVVTGVMACVTQGISFESVLSYLHSPVIQLVPVIGWYIAFLHLLFMGPAAVNIIGSILYFAAVIVLLILAVRMKCTGAYFEDATKFADDYEEARSRSKKGEVAVVGQKKKFGKAEITYKGNGAKALFYRQLLEYKKNRFFIFGINTLVSLGIGIILAFLGYRGELGEYAPFIILGVMAYLIFIFSSYTGKWGKELQKPYTYLLPDTSFHKLWYSTLIEHIRAFIDGCLITLPVGIVLHLPWFVIFMTVAVYVCLQASKLYATIMVEAFLGNILGNTGKAYTRLLFEGLVIVVAIVGTAIGTLLVSMEMGYLILLLVTVLMTGGMMAVAAVNFDKMESI